MARWNIEWRSTRAAPLPVHITRTHVHVHVHVHVYTYTYTRGTESVGCGLHLCVCMLPGPGPDTHTHTLTHSLTALAHVTHTDHTHTVLLICKVRGLLRAQLAVCNVEVQCASRLDTVPARHCCVCGYCCGRPTVPRQRNPHTGMGGRRVFSAPEGGFFRCGACALVLPPSSMRVPPGCHVD